MERTYDWEYEPPRPESEMVRIPPDHLRCTGWSKRNNRRCTNYRRKGHNVCRMHGSNSLSGLNHPNAKKVIDNGGEPLKYGKSIPARLLKVYQEGIENPDITGHKDEIALMEARVVDLMEQLEEGGAAELWREARKLMAEYKKTKSFNAALAANYLEQLAEVIEKGNHEIGAWEQAIKVVEQRRKLASSHHQQLVQASQLVPIGKVIEMLAAIAVVVQAKVTDTHAIQAILLEISNQLDGDIIEADYAELPQSIDRKL